MLSEYRQRFGEYHTELNREDYLFRSGRKPGRDVANVFSDYSDLFRLSVVEELRARLEETSEQRQTERSSIRRLIAFALEGNLNAQVREISEEIEDYESVAKIDWDGQHIAFSKSAEMIANEADRKRRNDLFARRAEIIKGAQDLLAERFDKLHAGARELGFENYLAKRRERTDVDYEKLAAQAGRVLEKTESQYVSALALLLPREAGVSIDEATVTDLWWLQRYARFDQFFERDRMMPTYRELFAALGFSTERQSNVEIDSAPRPNKQPQAFCSPIRIPDEIKLAVNFCGGQTNYREFLREAGHAQLFAWTSRNLYPEFQIGGDAAVVKAWGMLLENLPLDASWLTGTFGFIENAEFRHALGVLRLMNIRRQAARLIYETEFHAGGLTAGAGRRYAELMTDAVRVRLDETEHLRDLSDGLRPASLLRAAAFETQMRDYLKTQFGSRWWASRKAGETLIDIWNTGQRYSVEELATTIGLGELDFDHLTTEILTQT